MLRRPSEPARLYGHFATTGPTGPRDGQKGPVSQSDVFLPLTPKLLEMLRELVKANRPADPSDTLKMNRLLITTIRELSKISAIIVVLRMMMMILDINVGHCAPLLATGTKLWPLWHVSDGYHQFRHPMQCYAATKLRTMSGSSSGE